MLCDRCKHDNRPLIQYFANKPVPKTTTTTTTSKGMVSQNTQKLNNVICTKCFKLELEELL